jgi:hypothetical protein
VGTVIAIFLYLVYFFSSFLIIVKFSGKNFSITGLKWGEMERKERNISCPLCRQWE